MCRVRGPQHGIRPLHSENRFFKAGEDSILAMPLIDAALENGIQIDTTPTTYDHPLLVNMAGKFQEVIQPSQMDATASPMTTKIRR